MTRDTAIYTFAAVQATGWKTEESWFNSQQKQEMFLFSASRPALGPTQSSIERVPGVKRVDVKLVT
jgi:hypothetical protein